jgi:protein-S-isoprenylcysteine O-methyltransferase Ste14
MVKPTTHSETYPMKRTAFLAYGVISHLLFLAIYFYFAGWMVNFLVPKSIDSAPAGPLGEALAINLALIGLFAAQHSIMARPAFKAVWTKWIPQPIERSTYVLIANVVLALLIWQWRTIDAVIWQVPSGLATYFAMGLFIVGVLAVPAVSLLINHFDLFGTRQVWLYFCQQQYTHLPFATPMVYRHVRHPLYLGWTLFFWMTPVMTAGHLLFAASMTIYMVLASKVEERDLVHHFGTRYEDYRASVPAFVPRLAPARQEAAPDAA